MQNVKFMLVLFLIFIGKAEAQTTYERNWATYFGGEFTFAADDATDSEGNLYIAGYVFGSASYSNQFATANAFQSSYGGGVSDGLIAKFNSNGILLWATFFGGAGDDYISSIYIDKNDNIFIVGETSSSGLSTIGSFQENFGGSTDGFLARFTSNGSLVWSTYVGTDKDDYTRGVVGDDFGNIFLYGKTTSMFGITTPGSFQESAILTPSQYINFISRYSSAGDRVWASYYGRTIENSSSGITGISVNDLGFFVGGTVTDFVPNTYFSTPGSFQPYNGGNNQHGADLFLARFSFDGSRIWGTYFGGLFTDRTYDQTYSGIQFGDEHSLTVTRDHVYITGATGSTNIISTAGAFQTTKVGIYSNLIAKFDLLGERLWCSYLGNSGGAALSSVAINSSGDVYVSGSTTLNDISTNGSYQPQLTTPPPGQSQQIDGFLAKISSDGSALKYGTYYGGLGLERINRTLFHENGFYIIGTTSSAENISTPGSYQENLELSGNSQLPYPSNAFIAKFSEIPLSTKDFAKDNVAIYPVPNSGRFEIRLNENYVGSMINVIDISGKIVHTEMLKTAQQHIDIPNLAKGTYVVKITNGKGLGYEKNILIK